MQSLHHELDKTKAKCRHLNNALLFASKASQAEVETVQ